MRVTWFIPEIGMVVLLSLCAQAQPSVETAQACSRTIERFIVELDALFDENPTNILRYDALLSRYLFLKNGTPGLPPSDPDASIDSCDVGSVLQIVKRSKFFNEIYSGPTERYASHVVTFRSRDAIVSFGINKSTGDIRLPSARWTKVYP